MDTKFSAADEIAKLKALLDSGALTPEEFAEHKKQLLEPGRPSKFPTEQNPPAQISLNPSNATFHSPLLPKKKRKGKGLIIILVVIVVVVGVSSCMRAFMPTVASPQKDSSSQSEKKKETKVVFDIMEYVVDDKPITQDALIAKLGEPDNTDDWNYKTETQSTLVTSLAYGEREFTFSEGYLERITINNLKLKYNSKKEIVEMFGVKVTDKSEFADTGFAYRITNCGAKDFWIPIMTKTEIEMVKITYGDVFLQ